MTVMADALPGVVPVIDGVAGPAGGVGPVPAGGLHDPVHDPVADAADPFGGAGRSKAVTTKPAPASHATPGLVPRQLEPLVMLAAGVLFITGVSMLRSRQRRRRGWGTLPDRSDPVDRLWQ
jgi:hypothetical protein